jgi:4-cresol dehydrogenase (hydroxylating)
MHHIIYIVYETYDADSRRQVHKLILQLMNDCAENGWMEYWTYGALMDQASAARDLTNNTIARINTEVKDVIDPTGILEPGRNGVWPTRSDKSVWKQMADRSLVE